MAPCEENLWMTCKVRYPLRPVACGRAREQLARIFSKVIQARRAQGTKSSQEHDMMQVGHSSAGRP